MRRITILSLLLILSTSIYSQSDKELVLETFNSYKNAVLTDKGDVASGLVDSRTINYYSGILEKTKTADSLQVNSLGIIDKLTVLTMRHRASKKELLGFKGKDLLIYAINNGMVGKEGVASAELGDVVTNGDFSKAELIINGQKTSFYYHFYKEDKMWKLDITHLFSVGSMSFKQIIKNSGKTENEFIIYILERLTGKKPSKDIWKPIV
jgi:hypothetical protein